MAQAASRHMLASKWVLLDCNTSSQNPTRAQEGTALVGVGRRPGEEGQPHRQWEAMGHGPRLESQWAKWACFGPLEPKSRGSGGPRRECVAHLYLR